MNSLDAALRWYKDTRASLLRLHRIGERHWDKSPAPWSSDNNLRQLVGAEVTQSAKHALEHLDDLAIVVLFSVFESLVREAVLRQIEEAGPLPSHPVVRDAIETARDRVGEGSFFNVLNAYKGTNDGLIEEVNQVRRYRNWVAHGRRGARPPAVTPEAAYGRLTVY